MRLVLLLISALVIGFLLEKQLNISSSDSNAKIFSSMTENVAIPKSQEDIQKLRKDLNNLMQDTSDKTNKRIEEILNNK